MRMNSEAQYRTIVTNKLMGQGVVSGLAGGRNTIWHWCQVRRNIKVSYLDPFISDRSFVYTKLIIVIVICLKYRLTIWSFKINRTC